MVEDFLYQCRSCCALFRRWRRNLKQPLPAEVRGKDERILVASQIPKYEPALRMRIRYRSARLCCERCSRKSNTHKPEANDLVRWTTRPSGSPAFQLEQSRIRRESGQFGCPE